MGVNVPENRVDVGIPDMGLEEQTAELIREHLPPELAERFSELPAVIIRQDLNFLLKNSGPPAEFPPGGILRLQVHHRHIVAVEGRNLWRMSDVFSFRLLVQMQGWQENHSASYTSRSISRRTDAPCRS